MKLVHTADLHLLAGDAPRARAAFQSFQKVCALAKEGKADLLVIAGDAFHTPKDAQDGTLLAKVKAELDALKPTQALLIPGNQELVGAKRAFRSAADFGGNCAVFEEPGVLEVGGVSVYAFPFKADSRTGELFAGLPKPKPGECRVAVLHGTAKDRPNLAMYALEELEPGGDLLIADADLSAAGFRYAALGHIHRPDQWKLANGGLAAYPGSPWCVTVGEVDERSAQVVEVDPATGAVKAAAVPLGTPRAEARDFFVIPGGEKAAADEIAAYFKDSPKDVWRTAYPRGIADRAALDAALDAVEKACAGCGALPPEARRRDRNLQHFDAGELSGVEKDFALRLGERIRAAGGEEREVLTRAAVLGWLALRFPKKKPEEDLLNTLLESAR